MVGFVVVDWICEEHHHQILKSLGQTTREVVKDHQGTRDRQLTKFFEAWEYYAKDCG